MRSNLLEPSSIKSYQWNDIECTAKVVRPMKCRHKVVLDECHHDALHQSTLLEIPRNKYVVTEMCSTFDT